MTTKEELTEKLISYCEGLILVASKDHYGIINIGYGNARIYPNGTFIKVGDTCTKEQALDYMRQHLVKNVYYRVDAITVGYACSDRVYAGLCSLLYNGGKAGYSIVKALHDKNLDDLYNAFMLYDKVTINGVLTFSQGLQNRRFKEINYMKGDLIL